MNFQTRISTHIQQAFHHWKHRKGANAGQAMVEYALILILVSLSAGIMLAATGPAIGNVFSNVIYNIVGEEQSALEPLTTLGNSVSFWQTVEFVATNPQQETPYPTPATVPASLSPTPYVSLTASNTFTPSPTFTFTPTFTPTFTQTNTNTPTPGASETPADEVFRLPHADIANDPDWWRLDRAFGIGGGRWSSTFYGNSSFGAGNTFVVDDFPATNGGIDYNFGMGDPGDAPVLISTWNAMGEDESFAAEWIKTFTVSSTTEVNFNYTIAQYDILEVRVDGVAVTGFPVTAGASDATGSVNYTFTGGTYTLTVRWQDVPNSGANNNGRITLAIVPVLANPDDTTGSCAWSLVTDSNASGSPGNLFDESSTISPSLWAAGQTCYLELRGGVELSGNDNPKLTFWDIWDFSVNSGATAQLEVANYVLDVNGFFDRAAASWYTIPLRSGGTANYNWTRSQIELSSIPGLSSLITFRFVLTSTATGNVRWNIDDIEVVEDTTDPIPLPGGFDDDDDTYTVGAYWDLNSRDQMASFNFNGDASYTRESRGLSVDGWRWNLTTTNAHSGNGWDGSPGATFPSTLGASSPRIMHLELNRFVDVTTTRNPAVPAADFEGDTSAPVLSFWHAYDIGIGGSLVVQYTRDSFDDNTGTPDNWTTVPDQGLLLNSTGASPASNEVNDAGPTRTNLTMREVQVNLTEIPNWDTQPFRLRLALIINPSAININDWYVDDIRIERADILTFESYPMLDTAEDQTQAARRWTSSGPTGSWVPTTAKDSYGTSGTYSFADSPSGNYTTGTTTALEMQRTLDLLKDTTTNIPPNGEAARPAAVNPTLSFMWLGDMENVNLFVDVWTAYTNQWTPGWQYNVSGRRIQNAWERVEIDLQTATVNALRTATGDSSWQWGGVTATSVSGNAIPNDDDIRVRIRLVTTGGTARDGIFIDNISIGDRNTLEHRLWGTTPFGSIVTGAGAGTYSDMVETRSPNLGALNDDWYERWYAGGRWDVSSATKRSGGLSLTDTAFGVNYLDNSLVYLELTPVIDLRGTDPSLLPRLEFFTRYNIAAGDGLRIEIATENTSDTTQGYNNLVGWNAWTPVTVSGVTSSPGPWNTGSPTADRIDTWFRGRVNLSSYANTTSGRIRIRFVLSADAVTASDGIFLDDVVITYGMTNLSTGVGPFYFQDYFGGGANWVYEGGWGNTAQYFSASNPNAGIGTQPWLGYFASCTVLGYNCTLSGDTVGPQDMLNDYDLPATYALIGTTGPFPTGICPDIQRTEMNLWLGTSVPNVNPSCNAAPFTDSYAARWTRSVTLQENTTYNVYTIADDAVRLSITDRTNTNIPLLGATDPVGRIINDWVPSSGIQFNFTTFTVNAGVGTQNKTLVLDFLENTGNAYLTVNIGSGAYSATDSPNTLSGSTYTTISSAQYGYSGLLLNGVINLASVANPTLRYTVYHDLATNSNFYVDFSNDGGFTWNTVRTINGGGTDVLPPNDWLTVDINLNSFLPTTDYTVANFTVRFRLDTRTSGSTTDGVWIGSVQVIG
jgi:Flp pilus assembly pilin Flp